MTESAIVSEEGYVYGIARTLEGSYLWTLSRGSARVAWAEYTMVPILTDALAAMKEAGRGGIAFSIRDALGRIVYAFSVKVIS